MNEQALKEIMAIVRQVLPFVGAGIIAIVAYQLVKTLRFERGTSRQIADIMDENQKESTMDKYGRTLADRLGLTMTAWELNLTWAQRSGHFTTWNVGGILIRAVIYGSGMAFYLAVTGMPLIWWLTVPLLAYWPFMRVRGKANDARKVVVRMLPETATIIAAEMNTGAQPEAAVARAAEMPNPLGVVMREGLAEARRLSLPVFATSAGGEGALYQYLKQQGVTPLLRFGSQLDRVSSKGVNASKVMMDVARGFAREYRAQTTRSAANLNNTLLMPITIFFFLPFMATLLLPLIISMMKAF
jgi:Flp pilus assembly protein TadB